MKDVIAGGAGCSNSQAPTLHLATFRQNILAAVIGNPLFTDAEQLRTNHSVHECQDVRRLAVWLKNVRRVAHEREQAATLAALAAKAQQPTAVPAPAPVATEVAPGWATATQCDEIYRLACLPCFTAREKAATLRGLVTLTEQAAIEEIGCLYAVAWRRGTLPLHLENGATTPRLAA